MTISTFRGRGLRLAVILLLTLIGGCGDPTGTVSFVGTYDMQSFKGSPLPAGDSQLYVRSGTLELNPSGGFILQMDTDFCCNQEGEWYVNPIEAKGPFSLNGIFITLPMGGGDELVGRIQPGYILFEDGNPGSLWVLRE